MPVVAIALQGLVAAVIALSGRYEQILNYVVSVDFIFFGLTGVRALRASGRRGERAGRSARPAIPGRRPSSCCVLGWSWSRPSTATPANSVIGLAILAAGLPVYCLWRAEDRRELAPSSEYMEWAKTRSPARFNLASSGLAACPLAELRGRRTTSSSPAPSFYGYAPLLERLARKAGVERRPGRRRDRDVDGQPTSRSPRSSSPATRC